MTDLGGIPVRWFPASWTLQERKQCKKFQAVIHDIPEDMMMATLWVETGSLKKAHSKLKTKNTLSKKSSGKTGKASVSNKSTKKDKVPSLTINKKINSQLKDPNAPKKAKNTLKSKDRDKGNQEVLAEILSLLRRLV
ncbi:hypothetical protein RhiirA4_465267 [Rhizophagus irregularis]|uniref:Uncharacterized protein n=1 Tax=Rhizophagus irregularis TaxID=588596 RepID=A0A2I1GRP3_9GLOM|nr:hypothetical protein RhiirA4_465267 [Rhizophagus irregularis]